MCKGPVAYRALRKTLLLLGAGAFAFQVASGCDPTVRTTVLSGFQGLATSLVTAFFQGIAATDTSSTSNSSSNSTSTST